MTLKELREKAGMSQEALAEASGLGLRTIQRIESSNKAGSRSLAALASTLDVSLEELKNHLNEARQVQSRWARLKDVLGKLVFGKEQAASTTPRDFRLVSMVFVFAGLIGVLVAILSHVEALPKYLTIPTLIDSTLGFLLAYALLAISVNDFWRA